MAVEPVAPVPTVEFVPTAIALSALAVAVLPAAMELVPDAVATCSN